MITLFCHVSPALYTASNRLSGKDSRQLMKKSSMAAPVASVFLNGWIADDSPMKRRSLSGMRMTLEELEEFELGSVGPPSEFLIPAKLIDEKGKIKYVGTVGDDADDALAV